jgi:hypothetical protein
MNQAWRTDAIATAIAWSSATMALPCTVGCLGGPLTAKQAFKSSLIVLVGTVQEVELGKWASVRVDELYKGPATGSVVVESGYGPDCRMWLEAGKQYLLFLYREKSAAHLVPHYDCEPSREVSGDSKALKWVRHQKRLPLP